jgi:hypothetical protein
MNERNPQEGQWMNGAERRLGIERVR